MNDLSTSICSWNKCGQIHLPETDHPSMISHAANPVAMPLGQDLFRVFYTTRDRNNRSHITFADILFKDRRAEVVSIAESPVLSPGEIGAFDDSGCSVGCVLEKDGKIYLYYLGWNLGVTVPWRNSVGLAVAEAGETNFQRYSLAPILDRSAQDPFTISYPWVIEKENGFIMYYGSNLKWGGKQEDMDHVLKYATSEDGISWRPTGKVCIGLENDDDFAIARPCVVHRDGLYRMWYSYRGETYRIGYAESTDGECWIRKDAHTGIDVSEEGWDSEQISYAHVFQHGQSWRMLYNGNRYGLTGFGHATSPILCHN